LPSGSLAISWSETAVLDSSCRSLITVRLGGRLTMKGRPLLFRPVTVTTTFPVVAPAGTGTTMLVADQFVGVAVVPLNFTVLVPLVAPKFAPVIVIDVPVGALVGATLVRLGATVTV
jgi:hypothetical protein